MEKSESKQLEQLIKRAHQLCEALDISTPAAARQLCEEFEAEEIATYLFYCLNKTEN